MLKKIVIVSLITVIISFFCGDRATDIIASIFNIMFFSHKTPLNTQKLFTKEELRLYNGIEKPNLYLGILGYVFDVTKGAKHYGSNQQYHIFVGRDASRCFVTGNFNEEAISEEVVDFNNEDLRSINHWFNFYKKEYTRIGKLIGKYFDENGNLTPYGKTVQNLIKEAELSKAKDNLEKVKFPPCNVEWDAERGTRVWCSDRSGGILREWVGVPRQLYEPGSKSFRCACINEHNEKLGQIKEYDGCGTKSISCFVKEQN
ncbi:hypothetical protein NQ314_002828 [Rhamnusium bicolor]|uniref:Cytochrome b5 heme-binding domain-containing protein n=1 Tax=Rhamnusium bicolor TaxID=1586634 RepID=A0AAV8ZP19_9CUCU|nr:hypothetical protein NQ314_002828 [Rhamnusium bicolor]